MVMVEGAEEVEEAAVVLVEGEVVEGVVGAQKDLGQLVASNGDLIMKLKQAINHDSKLKLYLIFIMDNTYFIYNYHYQV